MTKENGLRIYIIGKYGSVLAFSKAQGIPTSTVETVLKKGLINSNTKTVQALADALNLSVDEILAGRFDYTEANAEATQEAALKAMILEKYGTMRAFADICGLPASTIEGVIRRGISNANAKTLSAIAVTLHLCADHLLQGTVVPVDDEPETVEVSDACSDNAVERELRDLIIKKYGSIRACADAAGVPPTTFVGALTRGIQNANAKTILALSDALGLDVFRLLRGVIAPLSGDADGLSNVERNFLRQYHRLDNNGKARLALWFMENINA